MRKLASIVTIATSTPIPETDRLDVATLNGKAWRIVTGRNEFKPGDRAVYFEIDSALPADDERFAFLLSLARGRRWQKLIDGGKMGSAREIAEVIGKDAGFVLRCLRITLLAPEIIERAARGELPVGLSSNLARKSIPDSWQEQMEMLFGE